MADPDDPTGEIANGPAPAPRLTLFERMSAIARQAVDEVLGPQGPGPFAPTYRTEGGSTRPVVHSEEAALEPRHWPECDEATCTGCADKPRRFGP